MSTKKSKINKKNLDKMIEKLILAPTAQKTKNLTKKEQKQKKELEAYLVHELEKDDKKAARLKNEDEFSLEYTLNDNSSCSCSGCASETDSDSETGSDSDTSSSSCNCSNCVVSSSSSSENSFGSETTTCTDIDLSSGSSSESEDSAASEKGSESNSSWESIETEMDSFSNPAINLDTNFKPRS